MDQQHLIGTRRAVRIEQGGQVVPPELAGTVRYVFEPDGEGLRVVLWEGGRVGGGTVTLNPTAMPKTMDVTTINGPQRGVTMHGVYRIDGDALEMCLGPERLAAFSGGGGPAALIRAERQN